MKPAQKRNTNNKNTVKSEPKNTTATSKSFKRGNKDAFVPVVPVWLQAENNKWVYIIILTLSFVLYGNTIPNLYTLDDGIVITKNDFTKQGLSGIADILAFDTFAGEHGKEINLVAGGRYRPLSVVTFAIEWQLFSTPTGAYKLTPQVMERLKDDFTNEFDYNRLFAVRDKEYVDLNELHGDLRILYGEDKANEYQTFVADEAMIREGNPHISHAINIVLYAITGMLVYLVLAKLFTWWYTSNPSRLQGVQRWFFSVPFIATILYVAHPIHTEVVANIKGRDEIMTFMGALLAMWYAMRYAETPRVKYLAYASIWFFLGLMSKENAITFLAIIPFAVYYFGRFPMSRIVTPVVPLFIAALIFLGIRHSILGTPQPIPPELMNDSFVDATNGQKYATIFYTYLVYFKLLIFPHPLTWDYYPYHIPLMNWSDWQVIVSVLINIALGVYVVRSLIRPTPLAFAVLFYFASLSIVSNFLFSIGVFMSERFMYISSLGFTLALAYIFIEVLPMYLKNVRMQTMLVGSVVGISLLLATYKVIDRNRAWYDNFTLFTTDVKTSYNSAKGLTTAGEQLIVRALKPEYKSKKDEYLKLAIEYIQRSVDIHPRYIAALLDLGVAHEKYNNNYDTALYFYTKVAKYNPTYEKAYNNINVIFSNDETGKIKYDNRQKQLQVYETLYSYNPNRFDVLYTLGTLYGAFFNNRAKGIQFLERALQIAPPTEPKRVHAYTDLGVAYAQDGKLDKSIENLEKAVALNPTGALTYQNLANVYKASGNMAKYEYYNNIANQKRNKPASNTTTPK